MNLPKVRFYEVHVTDGHGTTKYHLPARDGNHAKSYFPNRYLKVEAKYVGFYHAQPDPGYDGAEITFTVTETNGFFQSGDPGHDYLCHEYRAVIDYMQSQLPVDA